MSDEARLVAEAARGIFGRARPGVDPWAPILDGGWIGMGVPEGRGGQGGTLVEAVAVARAAGETAAAMPVVESILVGLMVSACVDAEGLLAELTAGSHRPTLIPRVVRSDHSGCVVDQPLLVPWGRDATIIVLIAVLAEGGLGLVVLPREDVDLVEAETLAGDPLDVLELPANQLPAAVRTLQMPLSELIAAGGLLSAARIVGALDTVATMSVNYANERRQFGRPIGTFQAIAHDLVRQASHVASADAALRAAAAAPPERAAALCDAARVTASLAVAPVSRIAHQVHGAIGFTQEHDLHRYTLRLAGWRDELASTRWWMRRVGARVFGSDAWWDELSPVAVDATA
jgi:acyl-CoA dehydrogenase